MVVVQIIVLIFKLFCRFMSVSLVIADGNVTRILQTRSYRFLKICHGKLYLNKLNWKKVSEQVLESIPTVILKADIVEPA